MRRWITLALLLLAGCQNLRGPFAPRPLDRIDDPYLSIAEQQRNGRDRLALPDESFLVGPTNQGNRFGVPSMR